jgi:hypothetical protein
MKSAFLLAENVNLFSDTREVLVQSGWSSSRDGDVIQTRDSQDRLVTLFGTVEPEFAWEYTEGPFVFESEAAPSDMTLVTACVIECRSEELFAATTAQIAAALPYPTWVLDGDGVIWDATAVDPARIQL